MTTDTEDRPPELPVGEPAGATAPASAPGAVPGDEAGPAPASPRLAPTIDPRMRARRIAVRKEAGRRRLRAAGVLGIAVGVLVVTGVLMLSPLLSVRRVDVRGVTYADPAAVEALVQDVKGRPMVLVDTGDVGARFRAIPWVKWAEVRRRWPNAVVVDVSERRPVATFYGDDGRYRVVDPEGWVVSLLDGFPVELMAIGGVGPSTPAGQQAPTAIAGAAAVANAMPTDVRALVQEIRVGADGALTLQLRAGGTVLFGPPDDVRAKLLALITVLGDVQPKQVGTLDLRNPGSPVLQERK